MESPKEITSRRSDGRVVEVEDGGDDGGTEDVIACGFMGVSQAALPGESTSADEREVSPNDESSVDARSISGTESSNFDDGDTTLAALSNKLCASSNEQKCSFTS